MELTINLPDEVYLFLELRAAIDDLKIKDGVEKLLTCLMDDCKERRQNKRTLSVDIFDSEQFRNDAYYNVAHALAGIDEADYIICQDVVDAVIAAIKTNAKITMTR